MFNMPARRRFGLALVLLAMAYGAGCGVAGAATDVTAKAAAQGLADANSAKPDAAAVALLPDHIRKAGVLVVGANLQQVPSDFFAADGKTPIGAEVDLVHAIGVVLGVKIRYLQMPFGSLIASLKSGRIDLTMSAMNDTKTREKTIDFVDYFNAGIGVLVRKGNPSKILSPADLCGKTVALQSGTTQEAFAEAQSKKCTAAGKQAVNIKVISTAAEEEQSLRTGRFDAVLDDTPEGAYISQIAGDGQYFQLAPIPPINGGPYGIGVAKNNPQLAKAVQAALQKLITDGTYGKILADWGLGSGAITEATLNHGT